MIRLSLMLFLFLFSFQINKHNEQLNERHHYYYGPPKLTTISGKIIRKLTYGPPGFGEDPSSDGRVTLYFLTLKNYVNIYPDSGALAEKNYDDTEYKIRQFQLSPLPKEYVDQFVGKNVIVTGYFYHAISGNHRTRVLMETENIKFNKE